MLFISGTAQMIMFFMTSCFSVALSSFFFSLSSSNKLKLAADHLGWLLMIKKMVGLGSDDDGADHEDEGKDGSLLDLPELALDCILQRLSPQSLCQMGQACTSMRDPCRSDHLWERHLKHKWGRLIGESAYREWQCSVKRRKTDENEHSHQDQGNCWWRRWLRSALVIWPFSGIRVAAGCEYNNRRSASLPTDSIMAWYLSLESGQHWFPAQVYNRENGHAGFMMSCYDAKVSYDSKTDTFRARYASQGRPTIEENIPRERLREPPVNTPPQELHVSDCLSSLRPGDHIEIQWRKSKEFPYGWWYGVVGHLDSCPGIEHCCLCHQSDKFILEFNQYPPDSRWRRTAINRKLHREEGSETNGFYGGIRKLSRQSEISTWKSLWPDRTSQ